MENRKHEFSTIDMLNSLKYCHITPIPPHNGHISTTATFFWPRWRGSTVPASKPLLPLFFCVVAWVLWVVSIGRATAKFPA